MIKIEVTGNSIPEVADKLIAIGTSLRNTAVNAADNAAREAMQAERSGGMTAAQAAAEEKPKRIRRKATDPVGEEAQAEAAPSGEPVTAAEEPVSQPDTSASAPSDSNGTTASSTPAEALDFTKHVMPAVLKAVEIKGHDVVSAIIGQFGVARASQVPEAQWQELIDLVSE